MGIEREEVKLMIDATELRIEAELARMKSSMDVALARMDARIDAIHEELRAFRGDMRGELREIRADMKSLRRTVIVTGISAAVAILFGLSAIHSAMWENLRGGLEAGTSLSAEHEAMRRDIRDMRGDIEDMRGDIKEISEYIKRLPPPQEPATPDTPSVPNK